MFCKKCGMRCDSSLETCANCGHPIGGDEYCGGFWGLVGEKPIAAVRKTDEVVKANVTAGSSIKAKKQKMNSVFFVGSIVLLGIAVIEAGFLVKNAKQLKEETVKYEELNEKYTVLLEEQEQLNKMMEELLTEDENSEGQEQSIENEEIKEQEQLSEGEVTEEQLAEDEDSEGQEQPTEGEKQEQSTEDESSEVQE